jgi:hypothetical protein
MLVMVMNGDNGRLVYCVPKKETRDKGCLPCIKKMTHDKDCLSCTTENAQQKGEFAMRLR